MMEKTKLPTIGTANLLESTGDRRDHSAAPVSRAHNSSEMSVNRGGKERYDIRNSSQHHISVR